MTANPTHRSPRTPRGFTLIELMVVMAIIAAIMGIAVTSMTSLQNTRLRAEAMRLSGALRMVYGRAAVNAVRYQVSFNIDQGSYSVECSPENVLIAPASEGRDDRRAGDDDPEADPFGLGGARGGLEDCSEPLLPTRTLGHGIKIARVLTTHDKDPVESGTNTIAYFPNGDVERALIWLEDDGAFLTLSIDPMSGRVRVYPGDHDVPDDFFEVEED